jgi:hypothetical protein
MAGIDQREALMYVDDCEHTFSQLASTILPGHMSRLREAMSASYPASLFHDRSLGPTRLARQLGLGSDFSGCYVLSEAVIPAYVGISRKVLSRLRQHFLGKTHYDASLAYAVAQHHHPLAGQRSAVMADPAFQKAFVDAQEWLKSLQVAFVEISNPLELYVFEAYAALELHTHQWNTFRTH